MSPSSARPSSPARPKGLGPAIRAARTLRDALLSVSYPQTCLVCGSQVDSFDDGVACASCWHNPDITVIFADCPVCAKCGSPLLTRDSSRNADSSPLPAISRPLHASEDELRRLCGLCDALPLTAARACGSYSGALEASILFLKSNPFLCRRLREILFETFELNSGLIESDLVIPVPLHRTRERERGFNQALLVARAVARRARRPLDACSLRRVRHTDRHRAGMDALDRARSVERAFEVRRPRAIDGAVVLLVDDILTTGSTLGAAADALLAAGAAEVNALTLARVLRRADALSLQVFGYEFKNSDARLGRPGRRQRTRRC